MKSEANIEKIIFITHKKVGYNLVSYDTTVGLKPFLSAMNVT